MLRNGQLAENYGYDAVGNRQAGPRATNYVSNNLNQLISGDGASYAYDANGNRTGKTDGTGITRYRYDGENKLARIDFPNGSYAEYAYDPFGRRIQKKFSDAQGSITILRYAYDGQNLLFELDAQNTVITEFVHGPRIDEPLALKRGGQTYTYHADALGSIIAITDQTNNLVQRYDYDAYGNRISVLDPAFKQPYSYTGREWDEESGLYYYRARYYDPGIGRFSQKDPIGLQGGINEYSYVGGNPINYFDPLGLRPLTDSEKSYLEPYIPQRDLNNADVHIGEMPVYAPSWADGLTRGNDIYFRDPGQQFVTPGDLGLLGHELVHVGQYADGMNWLSYLWANRDGYDNNPYEKDAYDMGAKITDELKQKYGKSCPIR